MGVQADLRNFCQAAGVPQAAVSTLMAQAPNPLGLIEILYGCQVTSDAVANVGAGVRRTTLVRLAPSVAALAHIVTEQGGKIQSVVVAVAGLDYGLQPLCVANPSPPAIGGPNAGVGALLRAFLSVQQTAVNAQGAAYNPATATIAFIGGLPPADTCKPGWRGCVRFLRIVDPGFGYPAGTTITVNGGGNPARQARATATFDASGRLTGIVLLDMGSRYTAVPEIGFVCPGGVGPNKPAKVGVSMAEGTPATATLTIGGGGNITAVTMTSFGGGYVSPPTPLIDPGGVLGSGFTGTCRMGVERIDVIAGGTGYNDTPASAVTITPQFQAFFPTNVQQAKAYGVVQTPAIAQQALSPVVPTAPIIT